MQWQLVVVVVGGACAVGCGGGGGEPDATPRDGAAADAPPPMNVHGTAIVHDVTDTGIVDGTAGIAMATIESITPTAAGFDHRAGTAITNGAFDAPVGFGASEWYLGSTFSVGGPFGGPSVGNVGATATGHGVTTFLVGNSTAPDLSLFNFGRDDVGFATTNTVVTLNVTDLNAFQANDDFELVSSNAGSVVFGVAGILATKPAVGATTITADTFDWGASAGYAPLVDAAKGDSTVLFQLVTEAPGTASAYLAIAKLGSTTGFTVTNGSAATLAVALADVPQTENVTVHFKRSQFDALITQVGPGAVEGGQLVAIDVLPGALTRGFYGACPDLVEFFPSGTTDIDATFTYGNPFTTMGTAWDEWVIARYLFNIPVLAAGATAPAFAGGGVSMDLPIAAVRTDGTLAPVIGPVRTVAIAGMDLGTAQSRTGVGVTPKVTWDAPAIGTATGYNVEITAVTAMGTATQLKPVANFVTKSTSLQIPDRIITAGASYILVITAYADAGTDFTSTPYSLGLPDAAATFVTAQFSP